MAITHEAQQYLDEQRAAMMEHQIPPKSHKIIEALVMELDYYRSAFLKFRPDYVPSRVRLLMDVCGDGPFSSTRATAGEHPCTSNQYGAISVVADNGKRLGVKPHEFVPVEWVKNSWA